MDITTFEMEKSGHLKLRALLEAGSPLPWEARPKESIDDYYGKPLVANDRLIVAAVNALPENLDRIEKLEAALKECADTLEESNTYVSAYFVEKHQLGAPVVMARALLETP